MVAGSVRQALRQRAHAHQDKFARPFEGGPNDFLSFGA
jgi:hypothetical protein